MNELFMQDIGNETTVQNKPNRYFEKTTSMSALLKETMSDEPFSTINEATPSYYFDFRQGEGEYATAGEGIRTAHILVEQFYRRKNLYLKKNSPQDLIDQVANDRITLLARKYVAKESFSDEESARLAIVTEKIRRLIPAVTTNEIKLLEEVIKKAGEIEESDQNIRRSMNLLL